MGAKIVSRNWKRDPSKKNPEHQVKLERVYNTNMFIIYLFYLSSVRKMKKNDCSEDLVSRETSNNGEIIYGI